MVGDHQEKRKSSLKQHGQKETRCSNFPWPLSSPSCYYPLGTASNFLPGSVEKYARLPQYLRVKCKEFAAWAYELTPKGTQSP